MYWGLVKQVRWPENRADLVRDSGYSKYGTNNIPINLHTSNVDHPPTYYNLVGNFNLVSKPRLGKYYASGIPMPASSTIAKGNEKIVESVMFRDVQQNTNGPSSYASSNTSDYYTPVESVAISTTPESSVAPIPGAFPSPSTISIDETPGTALSPASGVVISENHGNSVVTMRPGRPIPPPIMTTFNTSLSNEAHTASTGYPESSPTNGSYTSGSVITNMGNDSGMSIDSSEIRYPSVPSAIPSNTSVSPTAADIRYPALDAAGIPVGDEQVGSIVVRSADLSDVGNRFAISPTASQNDFYSTDTMRYHPQEPPPHYGVFATHGLISPGTRASEHIRNLMIANSSMNNRFLYNESGEITENRRRRRSSLGESQNISKKNPRQGSITIEGPQAAGPSGPRRSGRRRRNVNYYESPKSAGSSSSGDYYLPSRHV